MTIAVGDQLPAATLLKSGPDGPEPVQSPDWFRGRRVALFAVPGAFTPTCSVKHLPSLLEREAELHAAGVDEIACTAVNDPFVLAAWAENTGAAGKVTMLADGSAHFHQALGLAADASRFGMGTRSRRYSMLVADGVVRLLTVEQPGAFALTSRDRLRQPRRA